MLGSTIMSKVNMYQVLPKVIWEKPRYHPSCHRMDSPATCASCAMPAAEESNHSAAVPYTISIPDRRTHIAFETSRQYSSV